MTISNLPATVIVALSMCSIASAQSIGSDDFEGATLGAMPDCPWLDVGLIDLTPPNPPTPSSIVQTVTDAFGRTTKALHIVESIAPTQGIYALVPVSSTYSVSADVRIDQYSNNALTFTSDWAMQVGVGKLDGTIDLAGTPQVGIYASSLSQGWRLYAVGASYIAGDDVDLNVAATIGVWYHLQVDLVAATGELRSRIWDKASDTLLVDQTNVVAAWTPADGIFDRLMIIDGELSEGTTIANLATVDNVEFSAAPPIPPGPQGDINGDGVVNGADLGLLLANWTK